jgi:hypothetical protein
MNKEIQMNKFSKMTSRLVAVGLILAVTLLTSCTQNTPSTICHATGVQATPYEKLEVNASELVIHTGHPNDIIPMPAGGCPAYPVVINDGKITICHATGSETNPFNEITISINGLNGHGDHEGDIIPVPEGGCPAGAPKAKK